MSHEPQSEHRWDAGNGAIYGVRGSRPTALLYGDNLDLGSEHLPLIAGLEILRLAELAGRRCDRCRWWTDDRESRRWAHCQSPLVLDGTVTPPDACCPRFERRLE